MKLIKHDILMSCGVTVATFCNYTGIKPEFLWQSDLILPRLPKELHTRYGDAYDFQATGILAAAAETFVFSTEHILNFLHAVDRDLDFRDFPVPFNNMIIQFTRPIPESLFLNGANSYSPDLTNSDNLAGLVIAFPQANVQTMNVIGWYVEKAINRVTIDYESGGISWEPIIAETMTDEAKQDKRRLYNLALLCVSYITNPKVVVEKITTPRAVNEKRAKKGKTVLHDYYVCEWQDERTVYPKGERNTGKHVSFKFPVIGHWRVLQGGKIVKVKPHWRGLEHEETKKRITVVE